VKITDHANHFVDNPLITISLDDFFTQRVSPSEPSHRLLIQNHSPCLLVIDTIIRGEFRRKIPAFYKINAVSIKKVIVHGVVNEFDYFSLWSWGRMCCLKTPIIFDSISGTEWSSGSMI